MTAEIFDPQRRVEDPARAPRNVDLSQPEVANWGEIALDPETKSEMTEVLNRAAQRNAAQPDLLKRIKQVGALLGVAVAVVGGGYALSQNGPAEVARPAESSQPFAPEADQMKAETEASLAKQSMDEEAKAYHEATQQSSAIAEAKKYEQTLAPNNNPLNTTETAE